MHALVYANVRLRVSADACARVRACASVRVRARVRACVRLSGIAVRLNNLRVGARVLEELARALTKQGKRKDTVSGHRGGKQEGDEVGQRVATRGAEGNRGKPAARSAGCWKEAVA
eukprot:448377-Pleurochrysis_carterae.AAC.3